MIRKTSGMVPLLWAVLAVLLVPPQSAWSHAFGRVGVDHYVRITPKRAVLEVEYDVHIGELPTAAICARLDANHNGQIDTDEITAYVKKATPGYARGLNVRINCGDRQVDPFLTLPPGRFTDHCVFRFPTAEDGVKTLRITWTFQTPWPSAFMTKASGPLTVCVSRPTSGGSSASWIFVTGETTPPVTILESDVPTDLEVPLPPDLTPIEPDISKIPVAQAANIVCCLDQTANPMPDADRSQRSTDTVAAGSKVIAPTNADAGPNDLLGAKGQFAVSETTLRNRILALLKPPLSRTSQYLLVFLSFVWGAAHAFTPGHGKAIAGTYLVSTRASYGQAVALGVLVTVTHTAVVVVLSIAALILGDRFVYPTWLKPLGAAIVLLVGIRRIVVGLLHATGIHTHTHHHHHHDHHHHDHSHLANHDHHHADSGGSAHAHHAPTSIRDIAAVGVSGGLVPCPASVVLLLMTWQLGLPGLGFLCVFTFSVGLASTLIAVGIMAVLGTRTITRWLSKEDEAPAHRLSFESVVPILGGLLLTVLGLLMLYGK